MSKFEPRHNRRGFSGEVGCTQSSPNEDGEDFFEEYPYECMVFEDEGSDFRAIYLFIG